jgi:HEAT repeat protein
VRYYACQSLGRLGVEAAGAAIAARLGDDAGQVRVAAIEALSHLRSEIAFAALRDAAHAEDADIRRAALVGLGLSRRAEAAPLLLRACNDADPATRLMAVSAIADFDEPEALAALGHAAADAEASVRVAAIGFLSARGGRGATDALVALLPLSPDRERVLTALSLPMDGRIAALVAALRDADDELAPLLVAALVRMRRPEAGVALVQAFALPNVRARKAVASGLAALGSPEAWATLQRAAGSDPDAEVRRIATLLLAQQ